MVEGSRLPRSDPPTGEASDAGQSYEAFACLTASVHPDRSSSEPPDQDACSTIAASRANQTSRRETSGTGQRDRLHRSLASTEEIGMLAGAAASGAASLRGNAGRSRALDMVDNWNEFAALRARASHIARAPVMLSASCSQLQELPYAPRRTSPCGVSFLNSPHQSGRLCLTSTGRDVAI